MYPEREPYDYGIPGIMIHGRLDLDAPLVTAWELAQAWPDSELVVVDGAGHAASDPGMTEQAERALKEMERKADQS